MEINDFKALVQSIRTLETALGTNEKFPSTDELETIQVARKSLVAARDIPAGQVISPADLIALRPLGGLAPSNFWSILGSTSSRAIRKGEFLDASSTSRIL